MKRTSAFSVLSNLVFSLAALVMASEASACLLFSPPTNFSAGDSPVSVAVADLDSDTVPDLVTANFSGDDVTVLLGSGDGTFQAAVSFRAGDFPFSVAVADLDGDTVPDVVTANELSRDVSVLLGNGDGTFQAAVSFVAGDSPHSVAVADLDGDTLPDLVITSGGDDVSVLINLPEPASWLMLVAGIGFLGMLYRRRIRALRVH